ncbi:modulator of FtsH protease [Natronospira proteinivora]|uniref:Modulator of FtsH protease n=1 Tax=Natronospira proteinivora TaxID=1807133 RepID=A0ABT1G611_9GAMM|nr:Bax inhibitor-1/YccA family protein [Natronospira proteinivora]MCP1726741.1 modulator of FtsH protease [Natronospira proteinivora]
MRTTRQDPYSAVSRQESVLASNKVLRNTYGLLALTLMWAAGVAGVAMMMNLPHPGMLVTLAGFFGLLFLTHKTADSAWGLLSVFAFTGFLGYTAGPIVNAYVSGMANGGELVMMALGGTGAIFLGLSAYVLTTKKDFTFMGGFLFVGIITAFLAGLAAVIFQMPALSLAVSGMFVLLMSGLILFETSRIVNGGETNYIHATVSLFVSIYNLFLSLLHLLGFAND